MGKWTKYMRKYCIEWESDPKLKDWLRPVPGVITKAFCRFCKTILRAHHSDLLVHMDTRKHIRNTAVFLTSCKLKDTSNISSDDADNDNDTHLCGRCGTKFTTLSSFIHHKVEEEGYRIFYSPSERNQSLILPHLLQVPESTNNGISLFSEYDNLGGKIENSTSVSMTIASLPENCSDDEGDIIEANYYAQEQENGDVNGDENENEQNNSNEDDKPNEFFACCFCEKLFESLTSAQNHLKTSHHVLVNGDDDDDDDDGEEEDDMENAEKSEIDAEVQDEFRCTDCDATFEKLSVLKTHQLMHTDVRSYPCSYPGCMYAFKNKSSLERHTRRHTGERPFTCKLCNRSFSESSILARHLKSQVPCTMKSDAEIPRYGKPLKISVENAKPSEKNIITIERSESDISEAITNDIEKKINEITEEENDISTNDRLLKELQEYTNTNNDSVMSTITPSTVSILPLSPAPKEAESKEDNEISKENNKCLACNKTFNSVGLLRDHLFLHISNETLNCNICQYAAKNEMDLIEHHNEEHNSNETQEELQLQSDDRIDFHTPVLDKEIENIVTSNLDLTELVEKQLAELENTSLNCTKNTKKSSHVLCPVCKKMFKSVTYLKLHMKMHAGAAQFSCTICEKTFQHKDSLNKHMITHQQNKTYMCAVCGKMYKRISHAREHMRVHATERPYVCDLCQKGFKSRNGLKVHLRTHSDDMPFDCEYCECRFREKAALIRHIRTHTGEKPFACKRCGRCFAEHGTLNRHLKAKVPCTLQTERKKDDTDAVMSILYESDKNENAHIINEMNICSTEDNPDTYTDVTTTEEQQYVITEDPGIFSTSQIQNAGSYLIISQSDGTSETVVAELPIGSVMLVPNSETENVNIEEIPTK